MSYENNNLIEMPAASAVILQYLHTKKKATFYELEKELETVGIAVRGKDKLMASNERNMIIWQDMSSSFVNGVFELLQEGAVRVMAVDKLVYLRQGFIEFPAQVGYEGDSATLVWVPSVLCLEAAKPAPTYIMAPTNTMNS